MRPDFYALCWNAVRSLAPFQVGEEERSPRFATRALESDGALGWELDGALCACGSIVFRCGEAHAPRRFARTSAAARNS
ncbi:Hypothetical protein A7982_05209 [Minicystis rosea]|nr:Hypothetical protein A7982_05209 [Minicystis rosea]